MKPIFFGPQDSNTGLLVTLEPTNLARPRLFLRLKLRLDGIRLQGGRDGILPLSVSTRRRISVTIEVPELHGEDAYGHAIAVAKTEVEPNPTVMSGFQALADLRLPKGVPPTSLNNWRRFQDANGRLKPNTLYPQSGLPQAIDSFIEQVRNDLVDAIRRSCLTLRWRHSLWGPHNPLRSFGPGPEWSLDSNIWHPLPTDTDLRVQSVPFVFPTAGVVTEIQAMLDAGRVEPIAHQVFREAWEHRYSSRRSALVVAVAALEVGVKAFVGQLVPDAQWLIINVPSPPIKRILTEYLPTLTTQLTLTGKVLAPPKAVLELVERAVTTRNRVAHATGEEVSHDNLEEMLLAIKDVLWLLDYYAGASWALSHLSGPTRQALGLLSDDPDA